MHLLYIDPGSGSMILQVLAGGVVAGAVFIKRYWFKIKSVINFRKSKNDQE